MSTYLVLSLGGESGVDAQDGNTGFPFIGDVTLVLSGMELKWEEAMTILLKKTTQMVMGLEVRIPPPAPVPHHLDLCKRGAM